MTNMKKILFGLGTVTTVVAPVAAVVACGSDDKDTDLRGDWTVKNATELENLFKKLGGNDNAYVNDFPVLFTVLSNGTSQAELTVYQSNKAGNDWAILAKGNTKIENTNENYANQATTTATLAEFGIEEKALTTSSYIVIVKDWKVALQEVQLQEVQSGTNKIGLSKDVDETFSVN